MSRTSSRAEGGKSRYRLLVCWFVCSFVGSFVHLIICSFVRLFIHSSVLLFVHSSVRLFIHLFVCSFVCSSIHLFVCSFVHLFVRAFLFQHLKFCFLFSLPTNEQRRFLLLMWSTLHRIKSNWRLAICQTARHHISTSEYSKSSQHFLVYFQCFYFMQTFNKRATIKILKPKRLGTSCYSTNYLQSQNLIRTLAFFVSQTQREKETNHKNTRPRTKIERDKNRDKMWEWFKQKDVRNIKWAKTETEEKIITSHNFKFEKHTELEINQTSLKNSININVANKRLVITFHL